MPTVKQRSFIRYEIKLVATLVVNNTNFIQCMIRDFCSGGLFLQPLTDYGIESLKPLQTKRIIFSVNLKQGGNDFSLDAKIMHIRKHGIGVEFENHSEVIFEALKKEAQETLGLKPADRRNNPVILSKQKMLETDFSCLLKKILPAIISSFYQRIKAIPPETNETFKKPEYQATLQDVISNLEKNKTTMLEEFCSTVQKTSHLSAAVSEQYPEINTKKSLSLLDNSDFEDWLNILAVIRNLESTFDIRLNQLQKKIAYVIGVNKNKAINPANPGRLCDSFRNIINTFESSITSKCMLYDIFEKTLLKFLPGLYETMDSILIEHGAPVNIDKLANWTQLVSATAQSGTFFKPGFENNFLNSPVTDQAFGTSVDKTRNLIDQLQQNPSKQNIAATYAIVPEYSTEEIKLALTDIHQKSSYGKTPRYTPAVLKIDLLHTLENTSSSPKQLSKTDENSLDVYDCLFEILFNKLLSEKNIKSCLQRFYIPVINHAMLNPDFLETSNNPARSILNHLFWLELATDDELVTNTQTQESLDHLVEELAKYSLHHPSTFAIVERKLRRLTDPIKKSIHENILRVINIYEGKQKLQKAQHSVQEEFNHRHLTDKKLPKIICTLLDAGWEHLLVLAKLNEDNNAFQSHLRIIINLNGWLCGFGKASKEQADTTLDFIDTQLQSICTNAFLHDKILLELKVLLLGDGLLPNSDAMKMVPLQKFKSILTPRKFQDRRNNKLGRLKVGEWLTFLLEKEAEPLKLVWVGESQDMFVFVSRSGIKKLALNRDKLIALISKGDTQNIESLDIPLMDRATDIMLQEIHKKRVCNATHDPVTQLLNRNIFIKQLKRELTSLDNAQHLLCNIEIQDFNFITDECGLAGGDALLKQLADSLKIDLREEEIITQLDDKTFSVLLMSCPIEAANKVAKKLQSRLINQPFIWQDKSYTIAVNIGIVPLLSNTSYDINSLLKKINAVTLSAASAGRNCIQIYKEDEGILNPSNLWDNKINQIFTESSFYLRCQKIAAIKPEKNSYSHYKILLGIKDESGNIINPDDFFSEVENARSLSDVDQWVVLTAFSWIEQHQNVFETLNGFSINLSSASINSKDFLDFLYHTLTSSNIPLSKITFEIPEVVATDSFIFVQKFIKRIKHFNCKFALSDFGENYYSSHSFLKSLDLDYLIISKVLIQSIHHNTFDIAIVKSLIAIAHSLGLETITESVENDKIHAILREIGIDYCQGSHIQKPVLLTNILS